MIKIIDKPINEISSLDTLRECLDTLRLYNALSNGAHAYAYIQSPFGDTCKIMRIDQTKGRCAAGWHYLAIFKEKDIIEQMHRRGLSTIPQNPYTNIVQSIAYPLNRITDADQLREAIQTLNISSQKLGTPTVYVQPGLEDRLMIEMQPAVRYLQGAGAVVSIYDLNKRLTEVLRTTGN